MWLEHFWQINIVFRYCLNELLFLHIPPQSSLITASFYVQTREEKRMKQVCERFPDASSRLSCTNTQYSRGKWEMGMTETSSTARHQRVTVSVYLVDKKQGPDKRVRYLQCVAAL